MEPFTPDEGQPFKVFTQEEIARQNTLKGVIASYGGSKENQYGDSHIVNVRVQINGNPFFTNTCIQLKLTQKLNADHEFILTADPDEFGGSDAYLLQNSRQYLGSRITFQFRQFGKAASVWTGIISGISSKKTNGIKISSSRGNPLPCLWKTGFIAGVLKTKPLKRL